MLIESYGRVAFEGPSFSPRIVPCLTRNRRLAAAGFSARTGFSPPRRPGPELAGPFHPAFRLVVDGQRRYATCSRTTASRSPGAFKRAGWRRSRVMPATAGSWPEGSSPTATTRSTIAATSATAVPSSAFRRCRTSTRSCPPPLELAGRDRAPLFAEVDLISSHAPWTPIPRLVPWADVGDGSIFGRIPAESVPTQGSVPPTRTRSSTRCAPPVLRAALRRRRPRAGRVWATISPPRSSPAMGRPRRADLGHRPRPEGDEPDRRLAVGGRHGAEPAGAGVAHVRVPRPLPHRVRAMSRWRFDPALDRARVSAYAPGEFVGQEGL